MTETEQAHREKLAELLQDMPIAMLTTFADGRPRSVPMARQEVEASDELWFITARSSGLVDAIEASYPIDAQAERKGFRVLIDARKEVVYPSMSVVTRRKSIVEDRDTVMRMVRAHVEGIAHFKQNKEFSLRVLSKHLKITDREMLENSYETYTQDFISVPYPITKGLEATYDFVAQSRPEIRNRKPEEFVDASFISELEKSGFIKRLYEPK